jgi:hypothetical protein
VIQAAKEHSSTLEVEVHLKATMVEAISRAVRNSVEQWSFAAPFEVSVRGSNGFTWNGRVDDVSAAPVMEQDQGLLDPDRSFPIQISVRDANGLTRSEILYPAPKAPWEE